MARRDRGKLGKLVIAVLRLGLVFVAVTVIWVGFFRVVIPSHSFLMSWRSLSGEEIRQATVPLSAVSDQLVLAVIAAEDTKFCSHHGFDVEQLRQALADAREGKGLRGASTISQQTAKNVFLWAGRDWVRKGAEAYFTVLIEFLWPKDRILTAYLNVAEWGDGLFGAEAAAQARFGKSARDLTRREAALLAAVLPNPNAWRVDPPGPYVARRARTLEARMRVVARDGLADCVLAKGGR